MIQNLDELKPHVTLANIHHKYIGEAAKWAAVTSIFHSRHLFKKIVRQPGLPKISFYPQKPWSYYDVWKVCKTLGVDFESKPEKADMVFCFQDQTETVIDFEELGINPDTVVCVNAGCTDISKTHVQTVFKNVFGYDLGADPLTYHGLMVMKSEGNAFHDGQIVEGPLPELTEGMAYQRLIRNETRDGLVVDHRPSVIGGRIALVYNKYRPVDSRFANMNTEVEIKTADDIFSLEEQAKILEFARQMGLDYGGLDVLRHKEDGRIYIVDVNKTPWGPPALLSVKQKIQAAELMAEAFLEEFLLPVKENKSQAA